MKTNKSEKGFALISVYFVISVFTLIFFSFMSNIITDNFLSFREEGSLRSFWLAQAGLERAISELNYGNNSWQGWLTNDSGDKILKVTWPGFGSFLVTIGNPSSEMPYVISEGFFPEYSTSNAIKRRIEATVGRHRTLFSYAAFGKNKVYMGGSVFTDSYNSLRGNYNENGNRYYNGDVGSNNDIYYSGSIYYIGGDASTGYSGLFSDQARVFGEISHNNDEDFPMPTVPLELSNLATAQTIKQSKTLPPGNYKFKGIDLSGDSVLTVTGPANIYLTGNLSLDLTGQSKIVVTEGSGPVKFYVDGNISINGQGIVNSTKLPLNLIIFGTGNSMQTISLGGSGSLYGAIYAPEAKITLKGVGTGGMVFGSVVGKEVELSGSAAIHYDEALGALRMQLGKFIVQSWKDSPNPAKVFP